MKWVKLYDSLNMSHICGYFNHPWVDSVSASEFRFDLLRFRKESERLKELRFALFWIYFEIGRFSRILPINFTDDDGNLSSKNADGTLSPTSNAQTWKFPILKRQRNRYTLPEFFEMIHFALSEFFLSHAFLFTIFKIRVFTFFQFS